MSEARAPKAGRLFQEDLLDRPFWMLVACSLVNLTTWTVAEAVFHRLRESYVDERGLAEADEAVLAETLRPLDLYNRRAKSLRALASSWTARRPVTSKDVAALPGCGKYAADTWALFVERRSDVEPKDGKLLWYMQRLKEQGYAGRDEAVHGQSG